jgi:hypothetical protein
MSSPDRIPLNETQPERERRVFQFFSADAAACAGVRIQTESIESRESPAPDIQCQIEGHGTVAFELSEIHDQGSMKLMST